MPLTPDMPDTPDDDEARSSKAGRDARAAARMAANDGPAADTFDDRGDIYESEEDLEDVPAPLSLSDVVRESPIGAVIGAFVVGFLISRLI